MKTILACIALAMLCLAPVSARGIHRFHASYTSDANRYYRSHHHAPVRHTRRRYSHRRHYARRYVRYYVIRRYY